MRDTKADENNHHHTSPCVTCVVDVDRINMKEPRKKRTQQETKTDNEIFWHHSTH